MNLNYRGIPYESSSPTVETRETSQSGLFLGNRFQIKQFYVVQRSPLSSSLKYRGIGYQPYVLL